jgi:hypothetical protein
MRNLVVLQKDKKGNIYCQQLSEKGKQFRLDNPDGNESDDLWDVGGTIVLSELEEILDREI